jgi:hypothetical protein
LTCLTEKRYIQDQLVTHLVGSGIQRTRERLTGFERPFGMPSAEFERRYDDTPHHPALSTFPHHKHAGNEAEVTASLPPDLPAVLQEVEQPTTAA